MAKKTVSFNKHHDILLFDDKQIIESENDNENDTDYEDEDPKETLLKLINKRSFGMEEFGDDYESTVELKRLVETTFENLRQKANNTNLLIPNFQNKQIARKDPFINQELNDIPKILGKEHENHMKPCEKCSEPKQVAYNPCQVCSRETVDVRCLNCYPKILDLCSPKCREIYEGDMSVIEITNEHDETFIIIEDDGNNMVLQVINHKIFYEELNEKDSKMINKLCQNCNEEENENKKYDEDNLELEQDENMNSSYNNIEINFENDGEVDTRPRIGAVPLKCHHCNLNYSYLIVCGKCYQNSGMKYICDDCEN
jgi:hypothetical protein